MATVTFTATRSYPISAARMWPVVADLENYAEHARGLAVTELVDSDPDSVVRRCEDGRGNDWYETIVVWEPGRRYEVDVDTSTYPWLLRVIFRRFRGTWEVEPDGDGCRVHIRFTGAVRGGRPVAALVRAMAGRVPDDLEHTLDSYGASVLA